MPTEEEKRKIHAAQEANKEMLSIPRRSVVGVVVMEKVMVLVPIGAVQSLISFQ